MLLVLTHKNGSGHIITGSTENLSISVEENDNDSGSLHPTIFVPPPPNTNFSH